MPEYYTHFCCELPVENDADRQWLVDSQKLFIVVTDDDGEPALAPAVYEEHRSESSMHWLATKWLKEHNSGFALDDEPASQGFEVQVFGDGNYATLLSEEHGDVLQAADFIQLYLKRRKKADVVDLRWAATSYQPAFDGFGGGVIVVTKDAQLSGNHLTLIDQLHAQLGQRQHSDPLNDYPAMPECDRLREVTDTMRACYEFLDWLHEEEYHICHMDDKGRYTWANVTPVELLAKHFNIDVKKVAAEKDAGLSYIQQQNEQRSGHGESESRKEGEEGQPGS